MSTRFRVLLAVAACHLFLVATGAASLRLPAGAGLLGDAVAWYTAMSGADGTYRFFSPSVGSPVRATFTLTDAAGHSWSDTLHQGNHEVNLRLIKVFLGVYEPELRQRLAASWAGKMFARHPQAERVTARVEVHHLPTMQEYAAGDRPSWLLEYEAVFRRNIEE